MRLRQITIFWPTGLDGHKGEKDRESGVAGRRHSPGPAALEGHRIFLKHVEALARAPLFHHGGRPASDRIGSQTHSCLCAFDQLPIFRSYNLAVPLHRCNSNRVHQKSQTRTVFWKPSSNHPRQSRLQRDHQSLDLTNPLSNTKQHTTRPDPANLTRLIAASLDCFFPPTQGLEPAFPTRSIFLISFLT